MKELDDNDLLRKFRQNKDHRAFESILDRYAPIVHGSALRRVGSHDLAQDVTQKVFITLAQKAHSIKAGTPLIGWLHQVTRNTAIDLIRSENARKKRENTYSMDPSLSENSPQNQWDDIAPILDASLDELSEDDRNALLLRYFEGDSLAAVATSQGVSTEAARKRVTRALEKIRQKLSRKGVTASVLTITTSIQAHGSTALPARYLTELKAVSTAAIPATSLITKIIIMTAKTKVTAAAAIVLIGAAVITTKNINEKDPEGPSLTTSTTTSTSPPSTTTRAESATSSNNKERTTAQTDSSSSASHLEELFIDPKSLAQAKMMIGMIASMPADQLAELLKPTQMNPSATSYGLSETLASALQKQLDAYEAKKTLGETTILDLVSKEQDSLIEVLALSEMTEQEQFTDTHQARIDEIRGELKVAADDAFQESGLNRSDFEGLDEQWFNQPELIEAVKNEVAPEEHEAFDSLVERQSRIYREKVAFDRSQELAKTLDLTIEQRESLFTSLYENANEDPEQMSAILTPAQLETYSQAPNPSAEGNGDINLLDMFGG
ncbi:sigma-70 family RNA polymerase sigma factor [Akkermansiaceae bacterium]|nr:sigma-70 family RNA polymerase sigma factor [Akkermansiaceae bacterium]